MVTDIDEHIVPELRKMTKSSFDVEAIVDVAGELKYLNEIKKILGGQFKDPDEEFVKFFTSKVYSGKQTVSVKAQFSEITKKALKQFLNDSINDRLKSAIGENEDALVTAVSDKEPEEAQDNATEEKPNIVTTQEEIDGFNIVKAILRKKFEVSRIVARDTQSYFGVLLDDNNRKPLCRLHFNAKQKYLGIIDANKKETRYPIDTVDQIFDHADLLLETSSKYEEPAEAVAS